MQRGELEDEKSALPIYCAEQSQRLWRCVHNKSATSLRPWS